MVQNKNLFMIDIFPNKMNKYHKPAPNIIKWSLKNGLI